MKHDNKCELLKGVTRCGCEARDLLSEENHYKERIERLEQTLKTLIAWSMRDHGEHGVKQLLEMLDIEQNVKDHG